MFADTNALTIDDSRNTFRRCCIIELLRKVFMPQREENDLSAVTLVTGNAIEPACMPES